MRSVYFDSEYQISCFKIILCDFLIDLDALGNSKNHLFWTVLLKQRKKSNIKLKIFVVKISWFSPIYKSIRTELPKIMKQEEALFKKTSIILFCVVHKLSSIWLIIQIKQQWRYLVFITYSLVKLHFLLLLTCSTK